MIRVWRRLIYRSGSRLIKEDKLQGDWTAWDRGEQKTEQIRNQNRYKTNRIKPKRKFKNRTRNRLCGSGFLVNWKRKIRWKTASHDKFVRIHTVYTKKTFFFRICWIIVNGSRAKATETYQQKEQKIINKQHINTHKILAYKIILKRIPNYINQTVHNIDNAYIIKINNSIRLYD